MKYLFLLVIIVAGCSSDHSASVRDRQDEALRDPMNYKLDGSDRNDISGGGTAEFKKDALKKDINSVFGP